MTWRKILKENFGWGQFATLAAVLGCALGLLGFAALAGGTRGGGMQRFDEAILLGLRNPADRADPLGPLWLEIALRDLTALGSQAVLLLAGLLALGALLLLGRWASAVLLLVSLGGAAALNLLLKQGFARPRPDLVAPLAEVYTASFPSGHAMLSAAAYLTLGTLLAGVAERRRLKAYILGAALLLALLAGGSRVYLGVHWPSDVLAGWVLGAAWAMGCWLALRLWLLNRR
ncbi:phosphatase PAP2 family protein [Roseomonas sp. GC11]|uniref:phosphatase PAP2 family protein n=1 Tax=Roseomonas sp. GC11 TaxID=2950546 RepID=UPI00210925EB|nr:phosphatase PAP2 family protein [Roseomonas sp. GC11]MCQ4158846.1 phosphatase PAP2 family protein [Roseomonas sp. GC11]